MDLTPTGRDLLSAAREVVEKVQIARDIGQNHFEVSGSINIAATYTVCLADFPICGSISAR